MNAIVSNKLFKLLIAILIVWQPHLSVGQNNIIDEVIAVIGDEPVLKSDIEFQYQQALMEGVEYPGDLKCYLLEQMMVQNLLLEQAKIDSIEVSENQVIMMVDRQINNFINRAGSKEKLEEWLNKSILQIKEEQRDLVRKQMLTQQMRQKITENVNVTPSEIRRFFRETPKDSLPQMPAQYEYQIITVTPRISQEEIERVKARLRDFQRQVREGRDFATLAVLYSEDPNSAARGGEIGLTPRASLVPEFAQVAFNLRDKNKVSKIVQTEFGFHIMQLIERQDDRVNVRHILLKPKPSDKAIQEAKNLADSLVSLIRKDSLSFEEAALRFSSDKDSRANGGFVINSRTQSTKFELREIQPDVAKRLEQLEEGEISEPFTMKDQRLGNDLFAIVKLTRKIPPHTANIVDDYQTIKSLLENKKSEETFRNWIKKKQRETYISISEEWRDCNFEFDGWIK
ncbi:peptidylprolyl isomerase [Thermophagus xiamenensis]|uniref:Periplasmic chaperone for outer membrane proteins SurA n=1 Tax=Thermophagus xiamenensis TaxID=385682 RepID=A0A1I1Y222_9BACT|nr:peptidylprolyl isomerase [Thermophagus xiamenensis]SFE13449.1 periplasmic chaperone for outer membrane proteins SurA [Thermophagus xiamenensis]